MNPHHSAGDDIATPRPMVPEVGRNYVPPKRRIVRLWWRCNVCNWKVDTFGESHKVCAEAMVDDCGLMHLATAHGIQIDRIPEAVARFRPAGRTTRLVNKTILVKRPWEAS